MRAPRQHRRAFAICAALLWLLGVEVLPSLHLATHDDGDHTHATTGAIVIVARDAAEHARIAHLLAHAEGDHDHDALHGGAAKRSKKSRTQLAFDDVLPQHAATGLAHHATALHESPPLFLAPVSAPHAQPWRHAEPAAGVSVASTNRPNARGPPIA